MVVAIPPPASRKESGGFFVRLLILILMIGLTAGCTVKARTPAARIYKENALAKPGGYRFQLFPDGQGGLAEYLLREKLRNSELDGLDVPGLMKLFRSAFPELYLPVQPGVPLCNLETNFKHCKGIELAADFEIYEDDTVVLHSQILYHIRLRLEGDQPNFFRAAKAQRDRGEFALPRHYYVGALVEAIQKALPILQEIATDYRKYIKDDGDEIEIELILEASRDRAEARKTGKQLNDTMHFGGGVIVSALPILTFPVGLTVSALHSGGRSFWEVLKDQREFDLCRQSLKLDQVDFSYTESFSRNFSHVLRTPDGSPEVLIRGIVIRLRQKGPATSPVQKGANGDKVTFWKPDPLASDKNGPRIEKGKIPQQKQPAFGGPDFEIADLRLGGVKATLVPAIDDFLHLPAASPADEGHGALQAFAAAVTFNLQGFIIHGRNEVLRAFLEIQELSEGR
jgi:hypothetical protein